VKRSSVDALTARRLGLSLPLERLSLEAAQMASLRRTVEHARAKSPWYRERLAGFDPGSLRTSADLSRLPLLTSAELAAHGPRLVCVSQSEVARIITLQTSGSTGSPKRLHFTHDDLAATVDFFLHGMLSLISPGQRAGPVAFYPAGQHRGPAPAGPWARKDCAAPGSGRRRIGRIWLNTFGAKAIRALLVCLSIF
jgi:hypothetical protein